jgi:hypothetical protein
MNKQILLTKKIPAFTLMEVTVSMLIAAIAIAITYTAAHIVTVTYGDYQKKQDHVAEFALLDKLLKQDFSRPGKIVKSGNGLRVETVNGTILYEFTEGHIVRAQYALSTDTFKLDPKTIRFSFEKEDTVEGQNIDQLELQTVLEKEEINLIYKKTYSAQDLIQ